MLKSIILSVDLTLGLLSGPFLQMFLHEELVSLPFFVTKKLSSSNTIKFNRELQVAQCTKLIHTKRAEGKQTYTLL